MKIKVLLLAFFALVFSCTAFSQDSTKTKTKTMHHTTAHKHATTTKMKAKKMAADSTKK